MRLSRLLCQWVILNAHGLAPPIGAYQYSGRDLVRAENIAPIGERRQLCKDKKAGVGLRAKPDFAPISPRRGESYLMITD